MHAPTAAKLTVAIGVALVTAGASLGSLLISGGPPSAYGEGESVSSASMPPNPSSMSMASDSSASCTSAPTPADLHVVLTVPPEIGARLTGTAATPEGGETTENLEVDDPGTLEEDHEMDDPTVSHEIFFQSPAFDINDGTLEFDAYPGATFKIYSTGYPLWFVGEPGTATYLFDPEEPQFALFQGTVGVSAPQCGAMTHYSIPFRYYTAYVTEEGSFDLSARVESPVPLCNYCGGGANGFIADVKTKPQVAGKKTGTLPAGMKPEIPDITFLSQQIETLQDKPTPFGAWFNTQLAPPVPPDVRGLVDVQQDGQFKALYDGYAWGKWEGTAAMPMLKCMPSTNNKVKFGADPTVYTMDWLELATARSKFQQKKYIPTYKNYPALPNQSALLQAYANQISWHEDLHSVTNDRYATVMLRDFLQTKVKKALWDLLVADYGYNATSFTLTGNKIPAGAVWKAKDVGDVDATAKCNDFLTAKAIEVFLKERGSTDDAFNAAQTKMKPRLADVKSFMGRWKWESKYWDTWEGRACYLFDERAPLAGDPVQTSCPADPQAYTPPGGGDDFVWVMGKMIGKFVHTPNVILNGTVKLAGNRFVYTRTW